MKLGQLLLSVGLGLMASVAIAGPRDGGGGAGAIVCTHNGQVTAKLVDLVEMEFYEGFKPSVYLPDSSWASWEDQLDSAVYRIAFVDPEFNSRLSVALYYIRREIKSHAFDRTRGTQIVFPAPPDLSSGRVPPLPFGCQVVGAAVHTTNESVIGQNEHPLIVSDFVWKHLSERHKAALVLHEAVYVMQRELYREIDRPMPDSAASRRLVGFAFSNQLDGVYLTAQEAARFERPESFLAIPLLNLGHLTYPFAPYLRQAFDPFLAWRVQGFAPTVYLNAEDCHLTPCVVSQFGPELKNCRVEAVVEIPNYVIGPKRRRLEPGSKPRTWLYKRLDGPERLEMACDWFDGVATAEFFLSREGIGPSLGHMRSGLNGLSIRDKRFVSYPNK